MIWVILSLAALALLWGGHTLISSGSNIAKYAQNAGFTGQDLVIAVAIAYAESGGNPNPPNPDAAITPGGSIGLWQINVYYHPEFAGQDLTDPQTNADAAYSVYKAAGNSFTPWSSFKNGAYNKFIDTATSTVNA